MAAAEWQGLMNFLSFKVKTTLFISTTIAVVSACDDTASTTTGSATPVASNDFAARFADAYCSAIAGCCSRYSIESDTPSCTTTLSTQLTALFAAQFASPNYTYDASAAGKCIEGYRAGLSACTDPKAMDATEDLCRLVFTGNVALGGTCTKTAECVQNAEHNVTCDTGLCALTSNGSVVVERPRGTAGSPCAVTCITQSINATSCSSTLSSGTVPTDTVAAECWVDDELVCGPSGTCESAPALGAACTNECAPGAYCSGGSCIAQITTGSCSLASAACAKTSYCDSTTQECTPLKADGSACNYDEECQGGDCQGDVCRVWSVATTASCAGILDD